jgi:glycosyltransferase involved in cell wall biosynthesis
LISTLHISGDLLSASPGGLARYVDGLVRTLSPLAPTRCVGIGPEDDPNAAAAANVPIWSRLRAVRRHVVAALPETNLVASHFALYAAGCVDLIRKRPHVVHFHGPWARESVAEGGRGVGAAAKRFVEQRVYATADRAIALSRAFAMILIEEYRLPEERVCVIPGAVEMPTSPMLDRANARSQLGWPADRPIVLCVRRLARRMGLDTLIDAASIVRRSHPDSLVLIAGQGAIRNHLQARIDAAKLGKHVRLLGFVPEAQLPLAYAAADLSVVPSQVLEGFGLVTLESLVQGTPVLVTRVGGLPEVLSPLDESLVLCGRSAQAMAAGIDAALRSPSQLPNRDRCRQYVVDNFAWPTIAGQVLEVYRAAVDAAG